MRARLHKARDFIMNILPGIEIHGPRFIACFYILLHFYKGMQLEILDYSDEARELEQIEGISSLRSLDQGILLPRHMFSSCNCPFTTHTVGKTFALKRATSFRYLLIN